MATTTSASSGSTGTSKATSGGIVKGFLILAVVLIVGQWAWNREHSSNAPAQPTAAQGYVPSSGQVASVDVLPEVPLFKKRSFMVTTEWGPKIYLGGNHLTVWSGENIQGSTEKEPLLEKQPGVGGIVFKPTAWIRFRTKSGTDQMTVCSHPVGTSWEGCL